MSVIQEGSKSAAIVGLQPKSHWYAEIEMRAITDACYANQWCDIPQPVLFNNQLLGYTLGFQCCNTVLWLPMRRSIDKINAAGFPTYDSIINAITTNGTVYESAWAKGATTNGVANNWYDMWPVAGNPAAGGYAGSASSSFQFTDATTGSIPHGGNVSASIKCIMAIGANATAGATQPTLVLYDRCVTYENVPYNNNAVNTFTQTNTPTSTRYATGSDPGNKIVVTCQTVSNTVQQSFTQLQYTNQAGTASQSAPCSTTSTNIIVSAATPTSALGARVVSPSATAAGTVTMGPYMPLAVGDTGVQLIKNFITSAATINTGKLCFIMAHPLATLPLATAGIRSEKDLVNMIAGMPRVFDGACLSFLVYFPVATGATFTGDFLNVWN